MNPRYLVLFTVIVLVIAAAVLLPRLGRREEEARVLNFSECAKKGYPILESYPRRCSGPNGAVYTEYIGNAVEKADLIRLTTPKPNDLATIPLEIAGEARGYWFFEASFPVKLLDSSGNVLVQTFAQADGEWMTEDFIPFKTIIHTLERAPSGSGSLSLVLEKDNPSGLPEHADELVVPIELRLP